MVPFRILALGGGGTKGFLQLGALQELESRVINLTTHFSKGVYGCSIGSILATGIAFGMNTEQMIRLSKIFMNIGFVFDGINLSSLNSSLVKKGVFDMSIFETHILDAFSSEGIDLQNKNLEDAKIPLYILSSNITKGIPTIFKNKVPVLAALRASCCIPVLFRPQQIGNSLFIDGGLMTNVIMKVIPKEHQHDTLALCLIQPHHHITPLNLEKLPFQDYVYKLYKSICMYEHSAFQHPNIVGLYCQSGSGFIDQDEQQKEEMILTGRCIMRGFLARIIITFTPTRTS